MENALMKNHDAEQLNPIKEALFTFQPGKPNLAFGEKMLKYDEKGVTTVVAAWHLSRTVFVNHLVGLQVFCYMLLAAAVAWISWFCGSTSKETGEHVGSIVGYLTVILGFMLGSYVGMSVNRWWSVRSDCVGGLWGTIDDMCLLLSSHMPSPSDHVYKERFLRLGLLSYALVLNQARGREDEKFLWRLVERGLMTEGELNVLKGKCSKPQVVWVWISQLIHGLDRDGKIRYPEIMVPEFDAMCAKGRTAIGNLFAYIDTQLPYVWVHMLSVVVTLISCVISLKSGFTLGYLIEQAQEHPAVGLSWTHVFAEVCHVIVLPFAFSAFMLLGGVLANPLGEDFMDFPGFAYHCFMRDENSCFIQAGEETPSTILEGL